MTDSEYRSQSAVRRSSADHGTTVPTNESTNAYDNHYEPGVTPDGVIPGLLVVVADAAAGWLLYGVVDPVFGLALWVVAALVVCGLLADGVGRLPWTPGRPRGVSTRE